MKKMPLKVGDVVQIDPAKEGCFFRGCFLLVTEVKTWGVQGFISMPGSREELPGRAYFRARWEDMEYVGPATWIPADDLEAAEGEGDT